MVKCRSVRTHELSSTTKVYVSSLEVLHGALVPEAHNKGIFFF